MHKKKALSKRLFNYVNTLLSLKRRIVISQIIHLTFFV
ncbi:hypothetical protein EU92_0954 [Prochlorococcus marinus str. MIT 9107]|uniref:Uncharacterized protein n=1 Tax=Prochlorococcus marinus str. MIT 9116 TaxID=167544 RepID=A0A0A1ZQM4_PROMR|nr:hypothetical protein EU92_0954 [Prochlorococcus marinus str. MIT 9107]KGF90831.1 hypothetical protein EU93_1430 [Prochlorococcus marinus str. MIT 9116]KGF93607.1 hypothetical protein EU94_1242 [Prochlorococcus marinus str. MIT 9123]